MAIMYSLQWGRGGGGLGGVRDVWGLNYLCAHIHLRFRHAHHETEDWLPSLGCQTAMGGVGGGGELFMCPYPLKVQAHPPQDQRLATQSRVSACILLLKVFYFLPNTGQLPGRVVFLVVVVKTISVVRFASTEKSQSLQ